MKVKLAEYIDLIFADAERRSPGNLRLAELKEEMLQNLCEKYDDLTAAGRSPASAYNMAIAGIGDISDLLDSVTAAPERDRTQDTHTRAERASGHADAAPAPLTPEQEASIRKYRSRSAVLTSIAIALYILCTVPVMILGGSILGPVCMFVMIAAATALLIFNGMTKPKLGRELKDDDDDDEEADLGDDRPRRSPVYAAISGALWVLTVVAYLLVSFLTGYWHITWMIFLITVAIDNIIKAIFDLRR